jgi:two-component system sensor histidine kinase MprB
MSLRTKLLIMTSGVVLIAVLLVAGGTFVTTSDALMHEVDRTLDARVAQVAETLRTGRGIDLFGRRVRTPLDQALLPTRFDTLTQVVDRDGNVLLSIGVTDLPVTTGVLAVATDPGRTTDRDTITVDGTRYRMLTVALTNGGALQLAKDISEIESARRTILFWSLGLAVIAILAAGTAAWLLARRTARPIQQLAESADRIAQSGNLESPLTIEADREVKQMANAFNGMLVALRESTDRQTRLVQDASHELRTPLTSLRTNAELLERDDLGEHDRSEILAAIKFEIDALTELSTELSLLASNQMDTESPVAVVLFDVVAEVCRRAAQRSGRNVTVDGDRHASFTLRPEQFERAVSNLVDNAIKFSPSDTDVVVTVTPDSVQVKDHGPGIVEADRARVFDRFYRAPDTRSLPGSGLGLAIVKQFADDHGAQTFVLAAPGGGTVVGIRFTNTSRD